jgi:thioredoxin-like negative regulator of GroEL
VRDLPTIILFRNGKVEDFIVGTKPTFEVKSRLEELLLKS